MRLVCEGEKCIRLSRLHVEARCSSARCGIEGSDRSTSRRGRGRRGLTDGLMRLRQKSNGNVRPEGCDLLGDAVLRPHALALTAPFGALPPVVLSPQVAALELVLPGEATP